MYFDISSLWKQGVDWTFTNATTGFKYAFAVAGTMVNICAPKGFEPTLNKGAAIVYTSSVTPEGKCPLTNGTMVRGLHTRTWIVVESLGL